MLPRQLPQVNPPRSAGNSKINPQPPHPPKIGQDQPTNPPPKYLRNATCALVFSWLCARANCYRTSWGRKASTPTLVNRSGASSNSQSRTNSPVPSAAGGNAWTAKADERAAKDAHDQFTHLLYTLTVPTLFSTSPYSTSFSPCTSHLDLILLFCF